MTQLSAQRPIPGPGRFIPASDLQLLRRSPLLALERVAARYGGLFHYPVGFWSIYVPSHPAYLKHVLQDHHKQYSKATFQYRLLRIVAGNGLLSSDGPEWLRNRRLAQPAFHRERIAAFGQLITSRTEALLARWQPIIDTQTVVDIDQSMMQLALEIVGQALCSVDLSDTAAELTHAMLEALDYVAYRGRMPFAPPLWVPTPGNLRVRRSLATLDRAIYALIRERRQTGHDTGDLLSMLVQARDADTGEQMDDRQIRDELVTFLVAGHETVASAMTWTWHLLAKHPDQRATLETELDAVLGGRAPTTADLARLPYSTMLVNESLRLYPASWLLSRKAVKDDSIDGYSIPAGALIIISPYVTHRLAEFWQHPHEFYPEHFLPEAVAQRPRYAYLPFGGGPHLCIGNTFALLETKLVVATLAQHIQMRHAGPADVDIDALVTLRPRGGMPMTLQRRQSSSRTSPASSV